MVKRTIMIFPEFKNIDTINTIRNKYDPLADKVRPHITLVFPFDSEISKEALMSHVKKVASSFSPFNLSLQGIVSATGNYLFLKVVEGQEEIFQIHKKLYKGLLEDKYPTWLKDIKYTPHLTVGKIDDTETLQKAIRETKDMDLVFKSKVDKISVEIIGENEESIIEMEIDIRKEHKDEHRKDYASNIPSS